MTHVNRHVHLSSLQPPFFALTWVASLTTGSAVNLRDVENCFCCAAIEGYLTDGVKAARLGAPLALGACAAAAKARRLARRMVDDVSGCIVDVAERMTMAETRGGQSVIDCSVVELLQIVNFFSAMTSDRWLVPCWRSLGPYVFLDCAC